MKKPTWIFARESEYTLSISSLLQAYFKSLERPFLMSSIHSLTTHSLTLLSHSYSNKHTHTRGAPQNVWNPAINENSVQKQFSELNPSFAKFQYVPLRQGEG